MTLYEYSNKLKQLWDRVLLYSIAMENNDKIVKLLGVNAATRLATAHCLLTILSSYSAKLK